MKWRILVLALVVAAVPFAYADGALFNGVSEFQTGDYGYYYAITGGKFPTGNTPNGDNASGGTFRFVTDDPAVWGRPVPQSGVWQKDDWFPQNAGIALTLKNGASTVYDNNGIEDDTHGGFYDATGGQSADKPGLYRGYSMSNNFDWIYAGYFKIEETTVITDLIGYFDENSGFDRNSPNVQYRMNIWSNVAGDLLPTPTGSFDGDVFSSDTTSGSFTTSETDVDRVFGDELGNAHDDIFRLSYALDAPLTLEPGIYWFSHDAILAPVPEPATLIVWSLLGTLAGVVSYRRRNK